MPIANAPRVNSTYIICSFTCLVILLLAREPEKSRSLESESTNDAKSGEQSEFGEIMHFEHHKEAYNATFWTRKQGM